MEYPICRHIKTNGLQCQAPALHESTYCYFHTHLHQRHTNYRFNDASRGYLIPGQHIELCALEDREAVQVALSVVINALATGQIETRRATALFYGLQVAGSNAQHLNTEPYAPNVILNVQPSPQGLDLAQPGTVIEIIDPQYLTEQAEEDLYEGNEPEPEEQDEPYPLRALN